MKEIKRRFLAFLLAALFLIPGASYKTAKAEAAPGDSVDIKAEAVILVDAASGKILYQKNQDAMLHPASMTKMMTEYLVLDAIKEGKIKWDQKISISDYVFKVSHNKNLSNVYLRQDEQYSVKELYESMAIYSANGSAIALAELIAGSETNFIKMMSDKAAKIGLKDYKFVNCTGLNNRDLFGMHPQGTGAEDENTMSAKSVAILAYKLLQDHPEVLDTSSIPVKIFREGTPDANKMDNWNWMLPSLVFGYQGVDGLKTGSTDEGGYSFTATAKRGDMRLISVVMKVQYPNKTGQEGRFKETKKLLDYGFSNFSEKEVLPAGYKMQNQSTIPVVKGKQKKVEVASQKALSIVMKNGEENMYEPKLVLDPSVSKNGSLIAPLQNGQSVGYFTANYKGTANYGYLTADGQSREQVAAVTTSQVKKANFIVMLFRNLGGLMSKGFNKIKSIF
jgi:D-alanyl-D-alanine carboxypeptidase